MPFDDCPTTLGVGDILRETVLLNDRLVAMRQRNSRGTPQTFDALMFATGELAEREAEITERLYQLTEELNFRFPGQPFQRMGQQLEWLSDGQLKNFLGHWRLILKGIDEVRGRYLDATETANRDRLRLSVDELEAERERRAGIRNQEGG